MKKLALIIMVLVASFPAYGAIVSTYYLSSSAVTTNTTGTYTVFTGQTGRYEFGYNGTIDTATIQLKFKNTPTDDAKSAVGAALTSSLPSYEVRIASGQYITYTTTGVGTTSVIPRLTFVGY